MVIKFMFNEIWILVNCSKKILLHMVGSWRRLVEGTKRIDLFQYK